MLAMAVGLWDLPLRRGSSEGPPAGLTRRQGSQTVYYPFLDVCGEARAASPVDTLRALDLGQTDVVEGVRLRKGVFPWALQNSTGRLNTCPDGQDFSCKDLGEQPPTLHPVCLLPR